jgi:hypothetical protein
MISINLSSIETNPWQIYAQTRLRVSRFRQNPGFAPPLAHIAWNRKARRERSLASSLFGPSNPAAPQPATGSRLSELPTLPETTSADLPYGPPYLFKLTAGLDNARQRAMF